MKKFITNKYALFFTGIVLVILYYIPIIFFGDKWYVVIHDNLDSSIANIKMLRDLNLVFDGSSNEYIAGGLQRSSLRPPWTIVSVLFYTYLPLFWGVILNNFFVRIIAFVGMYLLLSRYVITEDYQYKPLIVVASSLCFALLSFYSDYGISSGGIPLIIYAFLNLKERKFIVFSLLSVLLFGLYSSMVISGVFVGAFLCACFLFFVIRDKRVPWWFFLGLVVLGITYFIANIHMFIDVINGSNSVSHRIEFQSTESLSAIIKNHIQLFYLTQCHTGELVTVPIFLFVLYFFVVDKRLDKFEIRLLSAIFVIVLFSLSYHILISYSSFKLQFQADRFYFFLPTLWIILFAHTAKNVVDRKYGVIVFLLVAVTIVSCDFIRNKEYMYQVKRLVLKKQTEPNYQQFYDEELFSQIASYIGNPRHECKVVSVGLYPAVAQYNGFYCLDGYWNMYPLEYKHKFRKVIANELEKSEQLKKYFDNWGSRCYVFSSELGTNYLYGKSSNVTIHHLDINTKQLQKMCCQYVFSAVPIENYEELGWEFRKSFTTDNSFWKIYLYSIPVEKQL